ncbi:MAG: glycosyltransferase family protein, partial [Gemmataceae bacterium]
MRVLFTIQGDGRGHLTQALAVQRILLDAGHSIPAILVGRQPGNPIPPFYAEKAAAPISQYPSFIPITDSTDTKLDVPASVRYNVPRLGEYWRGMGLIRDAIARHRPDVVLNFLEPLVGVCYLLYRPRAPLVGLANHFLMMHPDYPFPPGKHVARYLFKIYARLTAFGAARRLGLALKPMSDFPSGYAVLPPLLRPEVLDCRPGPAEPFLLIYLLKAGFREEIIAWHCRHPEVELHCFTDQPQEADAVPFDATLTFHRLDDRKFLDLMTRCRAMVATGGYQTLCEAMYLGKPILIVPVGTHFEQECNAHEGELVGAGLGASHFDLDRFMEYLPKHRADPTAFRAWVAEAPQ